MRELEITIHMMYDKWELGGRVGDPPEGEDRIKVDASFIGESDTIPGPFHGYLLEASREDNATGSFRYVIESGGDASVLLGYVRVSKELLREVDTNRIPLEIDIPGSWNW